MNNNNKNQQNDNPLIFKVAKWVWIGIIVGIVLMLLYGLATSSGGKSSSGCTICGKSASHTFQGSKYCDKHYEDAVVWAMNHVKN